MEIEKLLMKVTKILERLNISYLITGGIAVTVWGRPRATFDIDIVIELFNSQIPFLINALKKLPKAGYVDEDAARSALEQKGEFNFIDLQSRLKVDFWIKKDNLFSKNEFKRKILKKIGGRKIYFISPEDLILEKLLWYKESESTRHLEDIESILKISKVDLRYIRKWAERQNTIKILKKILKQIEEER